MSLTRSTSSSSATSQSTDQELPYQPDAVDRFSHALSYSPDFWAQSVMGNSWAQELLGRDRSKRSTQDLLTDRGVFDTISSDEAALALDGLRAMDPKTRNTTLEGLSPEQIQELVASTPAERQAELGALADATTDPNQRLQLWAAGARAQARADLADPRKAATAATAQSTLDEIADEVAHFQRMSDKGQAPTLFDVDQMIARKQREGAIENAYGVNLTNTPASDGILDWIYGDPEKNRRVWTDDAMDGLNDGLSRAPAGALAQIKEIQRVATVDGKPFTTGEATDGVLTVTDDGVDMGVRDSVLSDVGANVWQQNPDLRSGTSENQFSWDYSERLADPEGAEQRLVTGPQASASKAWDDREAQQKVVQAWVDRDPSDLGAINAQGDYNALDATYNALEDEFKASKNRFSAVVQAISQQSQPE